MNNYFNEIADEAQKKFEHVLNELNARKEEILLTRLKEQSLEHLVEECKTHRFKPISREIYPDREEVWINDGTKRGKLLVTFFGPTNEFVDDKFSLSFKYK